MRWATVWKASGKKDLKCVDQMKGSIEEFIENKLKKQNWNLWREFVWLKT